MLLSQTITIYRSQTEASNSPIWRWTSSNETMNSEYQFEKHWFNFAWNQTQVQCFSGWRYATNRDRRYAKLWGRAFNLPADARESLKYPWGFRRVFVRSVIIIIMMLLNVTIAERMTLMEAIKFAIDLSHEYFQVSSSFGSREQAWKTPHWPKSSSLREYCSSIISGACATGGSVPKHVDCEEFFKYFQSFVMFSWARVVNFWRKTSGFEVGEIVVLVVSKTCSVLLIPQ